MCTDDRPQADNEPFRLTLVQSGQRASQFAPGAALRRAREAQGLSLDDLCRLTKISVSKLVALEEGNLDALPGDVYVRGFLRAYAREVELDPEETVQDYFESIRPEAELVAVTASQQGPPGHGAKVSRLSRWRPAAATSTAPPAAAVAHDRGRLHGFGASQPGSRWLVTALAVIGLIAYLSYAQSLKWDASQGGLIGEQPVSSDVARASVENAGAAATSAPVQAAQAPVPVVPSVLQFEFQLQGPCWMSVQADGERVLSRLLQPGERQAFDVTDELVLRVGDPGALTFSINGQAGRPLGRASEPVNVRITKENYREFLTQS